MSLRLRLALSFAMLAAVVVVLIGGITDRQVHDSLYGQVRDSLDSGWDSALRFIDRAPPPGGNRVSNARAAGSLVVNLGLVGQTFNAEGKQVTDTSDGILKFPSNLIEDALISGKRVERTITPSGDNQEYVVRVEQIAARRVLLLAKPVGEIQTALRELRRRILFVGGLVVLLGAALGVALASTMTRRLRALETSARHIAQTGDLNTQIDTRGRDESGSVARSFAQMLTALQRSKDQQHQLIQDAGHELRTPLTSIRTNVYALRTSPTMEDSVRERVLRDLESETAELSNLINEVIELATDRRNAEPFESLSLVDIVDSVIARVQPGTDRSISRTATSLPREEAMCIGQRASLERAVRNLIENALKFDASTSPIDIAIEPQRITVLDRGPGVRPEDQAHIFDRFYRGTEARSQPGSGLGLAIVADIATRHGGTCFARTRDGGGSEIGFTIGQPHNRDSNQHQ